MNPCQESSGRSSLVCCIYKSFSAFLKFTVNIALGYMRVCPSVLLHCRHPSAHSYILSFSLRRYEHKSTVRNASKKKKKKDKPRPTRPSPDQIKPKPRPTRPSPDQIKPKPRQIDCLQASTMYVASSGLHCHAPPPPHTDTHSSSAPPPPQSVFCPVCYK